MIQNSLAQFKMTNLSSVIIDMKLRNINIKLSHFIPSYGTTGNSRFKVWGAFISVIHTILYFIILNVN